MVCYDISNPKRLKKTSKKLERYGIRVQKSFFQCEMESVMMEKLKKELLEIIHHKKDSLYIYPLCDKCSKNAVSDGCGSLIVISAYEII